MALAVGCAVVVFAAAKVYQIVRIERLISDLDHEDPRRRCEAVATLGAMKSTFAVKRLANVAHADRYNEASLRALGNCELVRLERDSFEELLKTDPDLIYKVMRAIVREVHRILRGMNTQYMEMSNYISKQHGRY